jgi:hypothetical protein
MEITTQLLDNRAIKLLPDKALALATTSLPSAPHKAPQALPS